MGGSYSSEDAGRRRQSIRFQPYSHQHLGWHYATEDHPHVTFRQAVDYTIYKLYGVIREKPKKITFKGTK